MRAVSLLFSTLYKAAQRNACKRLFKLLDSTRTGRPRHAPHLGLDRSSDCTVVMNDHTHAVKVVLHLSLDSTLPGRYPETPPKPG
jgi:hypothetical protein